MAVRICGGIFGSEKEAVRQLPKWKQVARNPKIVKSDRTNSWLVIVSEVEEERAEEAVHFFWNKGYQVYQLKGNKDGS